jgi:hypothetical protein
MQFAESLAIGVNSTVDEGLGLHIAMLDFDGVSKEKVVASVREVQNFWNLSDAYIYRTRHGFHVLFYEDQVPYERLRMIIDYAAGVDPVFKYIGRYHDHKTLRVAGKHGKVQDIVFECIVPGKRVPSEIEAVRGLLKRQEHQALLGANIQKMDKDKDIDKDKGTYPL